MNVLILGDGPDELAWAYAILEHPEHTLAGACPGFKSLPEVPGGNDLDTALARPGIDAVVCGGDIALRAEGLRRAASIGMRAIALHPPGPNADPYYQVALSRQENAAIVVPDIPGRLHPAMAMLAKAARERGEGVARVVRYELTCDTSDGALVGLIFPKVVDAVRALIGEVKGVTAAGIPSNDKPTEGLTVHLRAADDRSGEVRLMVGPRQAARLSVPTADGTLTFEHDLNFHGPARLVGRTRDGVETITELGSWDAKAAILRVLEEATPEREPEPGLLDGTRAMEITEAVARGLRKGRSIDLDYEEMSEVGNFKSVMTSVGCGLLLLTIFLMAVAAAGKSLGFEWAVYIVWVIPPMLVIFALFQLLRYNIKKPETRGS